MEAIKYIQSIPTNVMIFLALTVMLGAFFYITNNWVRETQMVVGAMFLIAVILAVRDVKPKIILEDAKIIAKDLIRSKKKLGIIEYGTMRESVEGTTRMRNGKPWYHEVCITVENPVVTHYVIGIDLHGTVVSTSKQKSWSVKQSPNVEIVTPPDFMAWYKLSKGAEKEVEEAAR